MRKLTFLFSIALALSLLLLLLCLRVRSFFREPLDISFPFETETIAFLILLDVFIILSISVSVLIILGKQINEKLISVLLYLLKPFDNLHNFLKRFNWYGTLFLKTALIVYVFKIRENDKIVFVTLFFSIVPSITVMVVLLLEFIYMKKLSLTFKVLPLFLLPLVFNLLIDGTQKFLEFQIDRLKSELVYIEIDEQARILFLDKFFFEEQRKLTQTVYKIEKKENIDKNLSDFSTIEIYYYLKLLIACNTHVLHISTILSKYNKIVHFIREILLLIIVTYIIFMHVFHF